MRWRRALSDLRQRYLQQQIELGGAEVVLPEPSVTGYRLSDSAGGTPQSSTLSPQSSTLSPQSSTLSPQSSVLSPQSSVLSPQPSVLSPQPSAGWRKGAPEIPGPGMAVEPPEPSFIGDDTGSLPTLDAVAERIRSTYHCPLCPGRRNAVPGEGNPQARMVLVGEGPGATEDATGRPFVGQAGQLLDKMLEAIELPRQEVYITNIVKCRAPQNRKPLPDEVAACMPYLHRQLALIRPKVILALGGTAGESLLGVRKSLADLRGKVHSYAGIPLIVTYHPAALLRNPNWKKPTWDDVRIARQLLDR